MVNCKLSDITKYSLCHEHWTKKKSESPRGIEPLTSQTLCGCSSTELRELMMSKTICYFRMWHTSCILLAVDQELAFKSFQGLVRVNECQWANLRKWLTVMGRQYKVSDWLILILMTLVHKIKSTVHVSVGKLIDSLIFAFLVADTEQPSCADIWRSCAWDDACRGPIHQRFKYDYQGIFYIFYTCS